MKQLLLLLDEHIVYAFFVGVIITAIIQSSTVVTGIAMSFLNAAIFPLEIGDYYYVRRQYRNVCHWIIGKYWRR